jgi:hypothetical protein
VCAHCACSGVAQPNGQSAQHKSAQCAANNWQAMWAETIMVR